METDRNNSNVIENDKFDNKSKRHGFAKQSNDKWSTSNEDRIQSTSETVDTKNTAGNERGPTHKNFKDPVKEIKG